MIARTLQMSRATGRAIAAISFGLMAIPLHVGASPSDDAGQADRGPIPIRDSRPFNLLFLQFTPETADVVGRNTNRYDLQLDMINNMQIPAVGTGSSVVEDNEYEKLKFSWRHGLPGNTEFGLFVPLEWRNAGFMDAIITAYHHLVGLQANSLDVPAGRDSYPEYRSILSVVDSNGNVLLNKGNAFGFGETVMTLKKQLTPGSRRAAMAVRLGLKLPTGSATQLLGSGHPDAGASIDGRYSLGREIQIYGNLGWVLLGKSNIAMGTRPSSLQTLTAVEYHPNSRDSYLLQVDGNGQFVTTGNAFADRSNVTASFGFRRKFDRHHSGFISFSEGGHIYNYHAPVLGNASPDFTVSIGMTWLP